MANFEVEVRVMPRAGLLDPQGASIGQALRSLGWSGVREVRVGKTIHLELAAADRHEATTLALAMCRKLLANPVTESYEVNGVREVPGLESG